VALGASFMCLLHCLALPLVLAALPTLAAIIPLPESFHVWMVAVAVLASGGALILGFRRHRATSPTILGGIGLLLLVQGATLSADTSEEVLVTVSGSLFLAVAHVLNWRLRYAIDAR